MSLASGFRPLVQDIIDLCELQWKLLSVDSQDALQKLRYALICGATAAILAGSALTVALLGTGLLLSESTALSAGGAFLTVGGVAFVIVLALLVVAFLAARAAVSAMDQSKSECADNLRWLKATLISPEISPRNRMRSETSPQTSAEYKVDSQEASPFFDSPTHSFR
jgi:hypothetical protein